MERNGSTLRRSWVAGLEARLSLSRERVEEKGNERGKAIEFAQANIAELAGYDHRFNAAFHFQGLRNI
jgi:ubiquinone/menaquinone biosynthesis C-methylase UbiE